MWLSPAPCEDSQRPTQIEEGRKTIRGVSYAGGSSFSKVIYCCVTSTKGPILKKQQTIRLYYQIQYLMVTLIQQTLYIYMFLGGQTL